MWLTNGVLAAGFLISGCQSNLVFQAQTHYTWRMALSGGSGSGDVSSLFNNFDIEGTNAFNVTKNTTFHVSLRFKLPVLLTDFFVFFRGVVEEMGATIWDPKERRVVDIRNVTSVLPVPISGLTSKSKIGFENEQYNCSELNFTLFNYVADVTYLEVNTQGLYDYMSPPTSTPVNTMTTPANTTTIMAMPNSTLTTVTLSTETEKSKGKCESEGLLMAVYVLSGVSAILALLVVRLCFMFYGVRRIHFKFKDDVEAQKSYVPKHILRR